MATSQVQARLNLNFVGSENPGSHQSSWKGQNFAINMGIVMTYVLLYVVYFIKAIRLGAAVHSMEEESPDDPRLSDIRNQKLFLQILRGVIDWTFWLYVVIVILRTRKAVRRRYAIPEEFCCSDLICVCCCRWFTVMQFGRHTADYDKYRSVCCSATGLPDQHPDIV